MFFLTDLSKEVEYQRLIHALLKMPKNKSSLIIGPPVPSKDFFGREQLLENLFSLWCDYPHKPIQSAAIYGEKRIGKTSILKHIQSLAKFDDSLLRPEQILLRDLWMPECKEYNFIFIDFQDRRMQNEKDFLSYILKSLRFKDPSSDNISKEFFTIITENLRKPTIIILDEIGVALDRLSSEFDVGFWEGMRALTTGAFSGVSPLGFLISSIEPPEQLQEKLWNANIASPFFNIFSFVKKIEGFSREEAESLIASLSIEFDETEIDKLLSNPDNLKPYQLQKKLYNLYRSD